MAEFELAIPTVLSHEGGLSEDPDDPGGTTNFGISLYWLKSTGDLTDADINHDGRITADDIRALTQGAASGLYRRYWWDHYRFDAVVSQPVATKLFDTAVNCGGVSAIKLLQQTLNIFAGSPVPPPLAVDGRMGPNTLLATNTTPANALLACYRTLLAEHYQKLVQRNPKLLKFLRGWLRRAAS